MTVLKQAMNNVKPVARGEVAPRRRRQLPGAGRSAPGAAQRRSRSRWLITYARTRAATRRWRRSSRPRSSRPHERGRRGQEARRHAQDGGGQQGLRALSLVVQPRCKAGLTGRTWTGVRAGELRTVAEPRLHTADGSGISSPRLSTTERQVVLSRQRLRQRGSESPMPRQTPLERVSKHRHHGPHRCRQDHLDRAHPLLYRADPPRGRGARRRRHHGLDGAGARARHHHHLRRHDLLSGATTASTSSTRPATSTSPSRWSAPARPRRRGRACSAPWAASSRSPRRCGARPTSTTFRASRSSTRWTASARTSRTSCR